MDTQWPRWEVFKQDTPGKPHQAVGSVHAVDPQHALVTARTVFVRRPSAVSLWVVRADDIFSRTAEELAAEELARDTGAPEETPGEAGTFLVFRKTSHKRSMTFVDYAGELQATSPAQALGLAREQFQELPVLVWWIIPEQAISRSGDDPDTIDSWFAPARDKTYRQQSFYGVVGSHASKHKPPRTPGGEQ
ncbi:phenylacetate metabolism protein [Deinococcus peraridilitoris]|uniref:Putative enzyme of phenylacetate metabolism n=1 Tax=Deinococcus peraridilitoris (strain DSM 19664 / LMG 22246 / CIP 109416 / KR-200) TaxID=937777 RepID=K9ZYW1_DEIPD|nr:phenylacetate metabolism protein [Deinococcus peraridilitoris]AFZ66394.1 putative enzyme of phenylacetate metabolism [Deinococcus peraridilitoris DSM 19664]